MKYVKVPGSEPLHPATALLVLPKFGLDNTSKKYQQDNRTNNSGFIIEQITDASTIFPAPNHQMNITPPPWRIPMK